MTRQELHTLMRRVEARMEASILDDTGADVEITLISDTRFSAFGEPEDVETARTVLDTVPGWSFVETDTLDGEACAYYEAA